MLFRSKNIISAFTTLFFYLLCVFGAAALLTASAQTAAAKEYKADVTEQLRPDYDYDKLLAEHENSLLGAYIAAMQKKRQDPVAAKALEYGVSALLGHEICR